MSMRCSDCDFFVNEDIEGNGFCQKWNGAEWCNDYCTEWKKK